MISDLNQVHLALEEIEYKPDYTMRTYFGNFEMPDK
jgi:hypothetical protein